MLENRPLHDYVETFNDNELLTRYGFNIVKTTMIGLDIRPKDYILIGGANLVLRRIIENTPDIDLLVSDHAFEILAKKPGARFKSPPMRAQLEGATNMAVALRDNSSGMPISATSHMGNGYYPIGFNSHKHRAERVEGIPCMAIADIIGSKQALGRGKDLIHLRLISKFTGDVISMPSLSDPQPGDS